MTRRPAPTAANAESLRRAVEAAERAGVPVLAVRLPGAGEGVAPAAECPGLIVEFAIPARPVPWKSPTITRNGTTFKDARLVAWQKTVAVHARLAMGGRGPYAGPVEVAIVFRLRRRAGGVPDTSNLCKSTEDSLQGVVIVNDRQVARITSERLVADEDSATVRVVAYGPGGPICLLPRASIREGEKR